MTDRMAIPISRSDRDALARIVEAEAGNQSSLGKQAVLFTVLNRAAARTGGFPNSVTGVIEQKGQFEPMYARKSWQDLPSASGETRRLIDETLASFASGNISDPTSGATFFQNPAITNRRGTNFAATAPTMVEGDHHFYNRYRLNPVVEVPSYTIALGDDVSSDLLASKLSPGSKAPPANPTDPRRMVQVPARRGAPSSNGSAFGDAYAAAYSRVTARKADPTDGAQKVSPGEKATLGPDAIPTPQSGFGSAYANAYANTDASIGPENSGNPNTTVTRRLPAGDFGLIPSHDGVDLSGLDPSATNAARMAASILGRDIPVTSGSRTQAQQDAIRSRGDPNRVTVARRSHHTSTNGGASTALDIPIGDMSESERTQLVDALVGAGFTGLGFYDGHIHADMRPAVPSSFDLDRGWGGWTRVPDWASTVLRQRGFAAGLPANKIKRGFRT